jgi:hypothetical protein
MYVARMRGYRGETRYRLWEYKLARPGREHMPGAFNVIPLTVEKNLAKFCWDEYADRAKFSLRKKFRLSFCLVPVKRTRSAERLEVQIRSEQTPEVEGFSRFTVTRFSRDLLAGNRRSAEDTLIATGCQSKAEKTFLLQLWHHALKSFISVNAAGFPRCLLAQVFAFVAFVGNQSSEISLRLCKILTSDKTQKDEITRKSAM